MERTHLARKQELFGIGNLEVTLHDFETPFHTSLHCLALLRQHDEQEKIVLTSFQILHCKRL